MNGSMNGSLGAGSVGALSLGGRRFLPFTFIGADAGAADVGVRVTVDAFLAEAEADRESKAQEDHNPGLPDSLKQTLLDGSTFAHKERHNLFASG